MRRQIANLIYTGRFRTTAATQRKGKPEILRKQPSLEIHNYLEMALAQEQVDHSQFFFVQIGAFDGREGDHLNQLIRKHGWRGVLVEPQPHAYEALQKTYADQPQLKLVNVAIGPQEGTLTLYTRKSGSVPIASVSKRLLIKPGHSSDEVVAMDVPCWTFSRLVEEAQVPGKIDLVQIDTEGFDFEIIKSIPLGEIRPTVIRYEHALLSEKDRNACIELLCSHGYRILLEDRDTMAIQRVAAKAA